MRALIQRVSEASVTIAGQIRGKIDHGLVVLVGFEQEDAQEDLEWMLRKITQMRIFPDEQAVMNKSVLDAQGALLVISQFTLHASTKKGNRPSYIKAAKPDVAIPLYTRFLSMCSAQIPTESGEFGADMKISLINDGPVTIWLDSKDRQ